MRQSMASILWRVALFLAVCSLGIVAIVAVYGELRFQPENTYNAVFSSVSGLKSGNFVRIAGVEVGKVKKTTVRDDTTVNVEFTADTTVTLTAGTRAAIRYQNLVGDRFMSLEDGAGGVQPLRPGQTIPLDRTEPAVDIDALIGGFKPLLRALDPDQANALTGQLIDSLQGQGPTINSFLAQTASLTSTLADRDQLIGDVINNLNVLLGSLGDESNQFDSALDSVSQLVAGLAQRKVDIANGVANIDAATGSVVDLLSRARPPLQNTVHQLDRTAGIIVADHEYMEHLLDGLPDAYKILNRQGLYGDYFSFYLCDLILKLNGKGGQPVYVRLASQTTGRCTPK
jgi:phospholipid/cholesterol/gamma-HCH transport system substrate-binding protein